MISSSDEENGGAEEDCGRYIPPVLVELYEQGKISAEAMIKNGVSTPSKTMLRLFGSTNPSEDDDRVHVWCFHLYRPDATTADVAAELGLTKSRVQRARAGLKKLGVEL